MPIIYKYRNKKYCGFCDKDCKLPLGASNEHICPNGHYIHHKNAEIEELQPKSEGTNLKGIDIYRFDSVVGELCNKDGGVV